MPAVRHSFNIAVVSVAPCRLIPHCYTDKSDTVAALCNQVLHRSKCTSKIIVEHAVKLAAFLPQNNDGLVVCGKDFTVFSGYFCGNIYHSADGVSTEYFQKIQLFILMQVGYSEHHIIARVVYYFGNTVHHSRHRFGA